MLAALGLGCVLFTACAEIEDVGGDETPSPPPQSPSPTIQTTSTQALPLDLKAEPQAEMHKYRVRIFASNGGELPPLLLIKRSIGPDGKNPVVFVLQNVAGSFVDETPAEGVQYRYEWGVSDRANVRMLGFGEIKVPVDVVFEGVIGDLKAGFQTLEGGRVLFKKNARVRIQDSRLNWKLDLLRAEPGAVLTTFNEGDIAADQTAGRNGGDISISAVSASGLLKVEMRGERGGAGIPGEQGDGGLDGRSGDLVEGVPMLPPAGYPMGYYLRCDKPTRQSGGDGHKGGKGRQGDEGMASGASGFFSYTGPENIFLLQVKAFETKGGKGGAGGPGGPGGAKGKASAITQDKVNAIIVPQGRQVIYQNCGTATDGRDGATGDAGEAGPEGPRGQSQAPRVNGVFIH